MLTLKKLFSDGMIFQRDTENTISGKADAGAKISLYLLKDGGEVFSDKTTADSDGCWKIILPPIKGSKVPYSMCVECGEDKLTVKDIYSGELFLMSGQSNMELPMSRTYYPFEDAAPHTDYPLIHEFRAPIVNCFTIGERHDDFTGGEWKSAVGGNILPMSATGYYFAAEIFKRLDIPVGLVNISAGGAAVESFMPYDMIKKYKIHDEFLAEATKENYIENTQKADIAREGEWSKALGTNDFGLVPSDDMAACIVPCSTEDISELKGFSGRLYFFREFELPDDFPQTDAMLILGTITDSDISYINGVKVGETGYLYPPRYYHVPDGVLKKGKNTVAVRVDIRNGLGGFTKGKRYCLKSGNRIIDLSGEWRYAVAKRSEPIKPSVFFQGNPLALYANMAAPSFGIKYRAMVWYQGESNGGRSEYYKQMFTEFVEMYRKECGCELPVIYTQLVNFEGMCEHDPSQSWASFRKAQLDCLEIPDTAMAVTADIGEYNDLHPKNKRDIGKRLAYCAGGLLYGDKTIFARCTKASASENDGRTDITLTFDTGVYLQYADASAFEAVFEDGTFRCETDGTEHCSETLNMSVPHTGKLIKVRYAWRNNPYMFNLFDLEMKHVSPFEITL